MVSLAQIQWFRPAGWGTGAVISGRWELCVTGVGGDRHHALHGARGQQTHQPGLRYHRGVNGLALCPLLGNVLHHLLGRFRDSTQPGRDSHAASGTTGGAQPQTTHTTRDQGHTTSQPSGLVGDGIGLGFRLAVSEGRLVGGVVSVACDVGRVGDAHGQHILAPLAPLGGHHLGQLLAVLDRGFQRLASELGAHTDRTTGAYRLQASADDLGHPRTSTRLGVEVQATLVVL